MLRAALDIPWTRHITNIELYGNLPKITDTLKERRLRFIGHVWRKTDEAAHNFGKQRKERENEADRNIAMLTN